MYVNYVEDQMIAAIDARAGRNREQAEADLVRAYVTAVMRSNPRPRRIVELKYSFS
jgi:hypothetical protein